MLKKNFLKYSLYSFLGGVFILLLSLIFVKVPDRLHKPPSKITYDRNDYPLRISLSKDDKWRIQTQLESLPEFYVKGILCLEDQRFYSHIGIDGFSLARAIYQNLKHRRVVSGASTISMQLARLLQPKPRTLSNKLIEALQALKLELLYSKKEILEAYLNFAPYGSNLEGVESAAVILYGLRPRDLNIRQMASLALLPQNPHRLRSLSRKAWDKKVQQIYERWESCGLMSPRQKKDALSLKHESFKNFRYSDAYHLTRSLFTDYPQKNRFHTTIDRNLQRDLESFVKQIEESHNKLGINNIGLLVVDNENSEVVAEVGNFDYLEKTRGQSFNSVRIPRSTGSTLKPFLYSWLIGQSYFLPESLVEDVPLFYKDYIPSNFDGGFRGLVSLKKSLALSLNIPFISSLDGERLQQFLSFLRVAGISESIDRQEVGLSMIVGGIELSLFELVQMFHSFTRLGLFREVSVLKNLEKPEVQWMNPGATLLTLQALKENKRPILSAGPEKASSIQTIYWKTGTSQGRRDAWAIGMTSKYTVGVWLGNLNNTASPALVGADRAGPIVFDVFDRIKDMQNVKSLGLKSSYFEEIEICSFSGFLPTENCKHRAKALKPKGIVDVSPCPFHKHFLADPITGLQVNRSCQNYEGEFKKVSYLDIPTNIQSWFKENNILIHSRPKVHPQCGKRVIVDSVIEIELPKNNFVYRMTDVSEEEGAMIPLKIKGDSRKSRCYLNGKKFSQESTLQNYLKLKKGFHKILCISNSGHTSRSHFSIVY